MKKTLALLLGVPLLCACSHLRESDVIAPEVFGLWSGEGRFYDRDLAQEYGVFPVDLEVHGDHSVTGTVGAATLTEGVIKSRPGDHLVTAKLIGPVFALGELPAEQKDCVIIMLPVQDGRVTGGNLHLKTNFTFDFSMRVGEVNLTRSP